LRQKKRASARQLVPPQKKLRECPLVAKLLLLADDGTKLRLVYVSACMEDFVFVLLKELSANCANLIVRTTF
jgi:hypothetical protein